MRWNPLRLVALLSLTVLAGAAGYLAGVWRGQSATMEALQREAAGNLTQRIEVLSLLRTGDEPLAITWLEEEADQLTLSIASNRFADRRVLSAAKTYRSVIPPPSSREQELAALFATLPVLDPSQCTTALRKLLLTGTGSAQDE